MPPTLTSKKSRTRAGWITPAAWNTVAGADAVEEPVERGRVADVADLTTSTLGPTTSSGGVVGVVHEAAHAARSAPGPGPGSARATRRRR